MQGRSDPPRPFLDTSDSSASGDRPYADWERLYWRQVRVVTIVLGATLGIALLATVVTLVAAPLDTTISYYRRSGQLSMLALAVPRCPWSVSS